MNAVQGAGGSVQVPAVVSSAAWPREGSVLAFIAGNCAECEQTDVCNITAAPEEPCKVLVPDAPKKVG